MSTRRIYSYSSNFVHCNKLGLRLHDRISVTNASLSIIVNRFESLHSVRQSPCHTLCNCQNDSTAEIDVLDKQDIGVN